MIKKISILIIITTLLLIIIPTCSKATELSTEVINPSLYGIETNSTRVGDANKVLEIVNPILGAVYYIGIFVAVGSLILIGIKYMMGSLEEKAQYKETLFPYLIGAVLLFGGINILRIIYEIVTRAIK